MQPRAFIVLACAGLWFGSLSAIGFVAVPLLFANLATPAMAGTLAAKLFSAQSWVSMGCGLMLLMAARRGSPPVIAPWAKGGLPFVAAGMLLALLLEHAVAPRIAARDNLALWHPVGTALYALQWACALWVLWQVGRPRAGN